MKITRQAYFQSVNNNFFEKSLIAGIRIQNFYRQGLNLTRKLINFLFFIEEEENAQSLVNLALKAANTLGGQKECWLGAQAKEFVTLKSEVSFRDAKD